MDNPTIRQIEAQCDAKLQQQADDYWDVEGTVEDEERFDGLHAGDKE